MPSFDFLVEKISGSAIGYLIVFLASGADVVIPIVPSETIVITAGIVAANGGMMVWLVIPLAGLGAMIGDNISYWLGRKFGDRIAHFIFRGEKGQARLDWAERAVDKRGGLLILIGRFIPGGRTASTFAAGTMKLNYKRFLIYDFFACILWGIFATMIGYIGGSTFKEEHWKAFALSLGVAGLVALGTEVYRQIQKRRGYDFLGDPLSDQSG